MSWEYFYIKHQLALVQTHRLDMFEQYCANAYADTSRFEWSCKFYEGKVVANRFLHLSAVRSSHRLHPKVTEFLDSIHLTPNRLPLHVDVFNELMNDYTERFIISYESAVSAIGPEEQNNLYLQLTTYPASLQSALKASGFSGMPDEPPPGNPGVMYCLRIPARGDITFRLYVAYDAEEYKEPDVQAYVSMLLGKRALRFLKSYPRGMLTSDSPRMLYVSVADIHKSEMQTLAGELALGVPMLMERLDRLTWVGLPETELNVEIPKVVKMYVRLLDT